MHKPQNRAPNTGAAPPCCLEELQVLANQANIPFCQGHCRSLWLVHNIHGGVVIWWYQLGTIPNSVIQAYKQIICSLLGTLIVSQTWHLVEHQPSSLPALNVLKQYTPFMAFSRCRYPVFKVTFLFQKHLFMIKGTLDLKHTRQGADSLKKFIPASGCRTEKSLDACLPCTLSNGTLGS